MTATLKFKSIWYSFFQAQNSMFIQKSIKPIDKFGKSNDEDKTTDESDNSRSLVPASSIDDYRIKRERNNESVRKSRAKNRVKLQECAVRVKELKDEGVELNTKLNSLQSELSTLRNLFQYCFSFNSNQMPFKPSEIPTSTLYKVIMQNKSKFMQPVTTNLTETLQQANATLSFPPVTLNQTNSSSLFTNNTTTALQTPTSNSSSSFDSVLEQSRTLTLDDFDNEPSLNNSTVTLNNGLQDQAALFDEKDSFFINELKQSLIDFMKTDELINTTPSETVSTVSSPFMSSPTTPSSNNDYLFTDDILIDNENDMNANFNLSSVLDDHDYSIKRAKFNL